MATKIEILKSALWHAIEKIASKKKARALLADGSAHRVQLEISGTVDGKAISETIAGQLKVGHELTRSSTVNPDVKTLLALFAEKLTDRQRNALIKKIKADFAKSNELPAADAETIATTEQLLKELRFTKSTTAKGAVSFAVE